jgi:iron complex outermembrane receptor protein
VQALFGELSIPFAKGVEAQVAARYDHYSDFGSTVQPKVAIRWQPTRSLLMRASWGTGFRAPTLYDLHEPQLRTPLVFFEDPARCPVTQADRDCVVSSAVGAAIRTSSPSGRRR